MMDEEEVKVSRVLVLSPEVHGAWKPVGGSSIVGLPEVGGEVQLGQDEDHLAVLLEQLVQTVQDVLPGLVLQHVSHSDESGAFGCDLHRGPGHGHGVCTDRLRLVVDSVHVHWRNEVGPLV